MRDQEILGLYAAYNQVYSEGSFNNLIDTGASIIKKPVQDYANKRVGGLAGVLGIPGAVAGQKVDQTATDLKNRKYGKALNTVVSGVRTLTQSYDLYDVILSHLLDEGFASDEKSAEAIMGSMSEAWVESIVEKAPTVSSPGGVGGEVTADKQYPATLRGLKGVKSTDSKGTEYFQPYTSSGRKEASGKPFGPTTMPDTNRAQYKQLYSGKYENIPASQSTKNPESHLSRTGIPKVRSATSTYGID